MSPKRKYKTCIISFILLFSSITLFITIPESVKAEGNSKETLYFSNFNLTEYFETFQYPEMSPTLPDSNNQTNFPPTLASPEDFASWFLFWFFLKMGGEEGLEFEDEFDIFEMFDPFKIEQIYIFEGEEDIRISGRMQFDLYFTSNLPTKLGWHDKIQITVYLNQVELNNASATIDPKFFGGRIQKQTIFIEDLDFTIEDGDELLFSIKMMPGDKLIGNLIKRRNLENILQTAELIADSLIEQESNPSLQDLGYVIKDFVNASNTGELNLTLDDIAELVNAVRASSFVFGSSRYPSSVTLPSKISDEENIKILYLRSEGKLLEEESDSEKATIVSLKDPQRWTGLGPSRYKILKKATANLYLDYRDLIRLLNLGKAKVNATLIYDDETIGTSEIELEKTTILQPLLKAIEPTILTFDFLEREIENDKDLILEVGVSAGTKFGPLERSIYRYINLIYESAIYPSYLSLTFGETDHIKMQFDTEDTQDIITGGSAKYLLNITSEFDDNVSIGIDIADKSGEWRFDHPETVQVSPEKYTLVPVYIIHENEELAAYNRDYIEFSLYVAGTKGYASQEGLVKVRKEAVEYNVNVDYAKSKDIKHGEKGTFTFIIENNNTGLLPDSYSITAISEHDWPIDLNFNDSDLENVESGDDFIVKATVLVPSYTDIASDKLTLKITSLESGKYNDEKIFEVIVTTKVILPNILEHFYHFFENAAEGLGLDEVLSDYAAAFLIFIIFFLIFIFLLLAILIIRRKYIEIICLDRIKDIDPESVAIFKMEIRNPTKERLSYEISAEKQSTSEGWDIIFETKTISIDSKQSQFIELLVKPTDYVKPDDWIEVKIIAKTLEKNKVEEISVVTSIKPEKPKLDISGIYHWPRIFKKGSLVKTSFRIRNSGRVAANSVKILLNVNGKEKNKVEDITIPSGGYAKVEIPWIAVKGKNHLDIVII